MVVPPKIRGSGPTELVSFFVGEIPCHSMQYYTIPRNTVQPETPQKQSLDTQVVRENENVTLGCDATGYPKVGFQ